MNELSIHRNRLAAILVGLGLFGLLVLWRVLAIGAVDHDRYVAMARDRHWTTETLYAQRGTVRDRNGRPLATTIQKFDVSALGASVTRPEETARALSPLLGMTPEEILARFQEARETRRTVVVKRAVEFPTGEQIAALRLNGIYLSPRIDRAYPEGNLGGSFLGIVGRDQVGLAGIEADYNRELMGRHGSITYERDPVGGQIPLGFREVEQSVPGGDVVLTIDRFIQGVVEEELDAAIARTRASGGTIVVMNPNTGEILGLASRPSFNLLEGGTVTDLAQLRNRAVTDTYEPGSTFKALTVAAAIDAGAVTPTSSMNDSGVYQAQGVSIRNWNNSANGVIDVTEILRRSSNVGTIWVAEQLGADRFYQYLERFGIGRRTNIDLSGEAPGAYRTNRSPFWSPLDLATNSFGQGLTVTPIQLLAAEASLINGGRLLRPYLVKEVRNGDEVRRFAPVEIGRTISEQTSATMREVLNAAAEQGETNLAIVPGYTIGGKTGTGSIATPQGYTTNLTIASFVGFAPVENPQIIVLVKIDEPRTSPWGSVVASPVFSRVMQKALVYLRVPPNGAQVAAR